MIMAAIVCIVVLTTIAVMIGTQPATGLDGGSNGLFLWEPGRYVDDSGTGRAESFQGAATRESYQPR
jgi:hypothetical protein